MKSLFEYDSYRKYLEDYFQEMKAKRKTFSYRSFARKAGFSSCGFCHQVVTGERNLTPQATEKMIQGIGMDGKKAEYFQALVRFEQAERAEEKEKAFAQINILRKDSAFMRLNRSHLRYFEYWWYPVLRNLVVYAPWGDDYRLLASLVHPPISEAQARQGVKVLEELELVKRDSQGCWQMTATLLHSGEVPAQIKYQTRKEILQLGLDSLDNYPSSERHATYYTLGIQASSYEKLRALIEELNAKAACIAAEDQDVQRVYELSVLLYPLSKKWRN